MAVQERYTELEGRVIAAAVTLAIFIAVFPAVLAGTAVIGFIAQRHIDLSSQVIDRLGLTGNAADTLQSAIDTASRTRRAASIVGLAGLVWSSIGVVRAIQL